MSSILNFTDRIKKVSIDANKIVSENNEYLILYSNGIINRLEMFRKSQNIFDKITNILSRITELDKQIKRKYRTQIFGKEYLLEHLSHPKNLVQSFHQELLSRLQNLLRERNTRTQQNTQKCQCHITSFELESENIEICGICMQENCVGIRPECCNKKQMICLICLKESCKQQFKQKFKSELQTPINEQLFNVHYNCSFCRQEYCGQKYKYIFDQ